MENWKWRRATNNVYPPPMDSAGESMAKQQLHRSHAQVLNRLKRASGHLNSLIRMIEEDRPCLDLAQQLQAIESAVAKAKKALIHDHIDTCIHAAIGSAGQKSRGAIAEFKEITKYL
jgi:DNA-binding FrmR family transcriptional regulator